VELSAAAAAGTRYLPHSYLPRRGAGQSNMYTSMPGLENPSDIRTGFVCCLWSIAREPLSLWRGHQM